MRPTEPDRIQLRIWERLYYLDPASMFDGFMRLFAKWAKKGYAPSEFDRLLRRDKSRWERWQATLFCYGQQVAVHGQPFFFTQYEAADYDIVCRLGEAGDYKYVPVQLKEVVAAFLDADMSAQDILDKLGMYRTSGGTTFAIYLNRFQAVGLDGALSGEPRIGDLWVYGMLADEATPSFGLLGPDIEQPELYRYEIPA
jgi:hypothetical protein